MRDSLFILLQHLLPQKLLSRLMGLLADRPLGALTQWLIRLFVRRYQVDLAEAEPSTPTGYASFNAFFTRPLRAGARPIAAEPHSLVSPADGQITEHGPLLGQRLVQAKGRHYTLQALLAGDQQAVEQFRDGDYCTLYLSPRDYHRVHMPVDGRLTSMVHVPGRLFSVNQLSAERVEDLFARNERVICHFDTDEGPLAVILVGALIVGSIETGWAGVVTPPGRGISRWQGGTPVALKRGDELGRFRLGSTVILLLPPGRMRWNANLTQQPVRMGQALGQFKG